MAEEAWLQAEVTALADAAPWRIFSGKRLFDLQRA
jgi:hypothetical protein